MKSYTTMKKILSFLTSLTLLSGTPLLAQLSSQQFQQPEPDTHVIAWWHWLNGNITRDGITRDLEAMKAVGINQATFLNVWRDMPDADVPQKARFNSPEWWGMVRWAMQEATRLDMSLGAANCDGWSESGGPWITPDLSMKEYVWTKTPLSLSLDKKGRLSLKDKIATYDVALPMPAHKQSYYRDVCVLLYPKSFEGQAIDPKDIIDVTKYVDITGTLHLPATFFQTITHNTNFPSSPLGGDRGGLGVLLRFGYTTTGKTNNPATWEGRGLECDKMDTVALNVHWANYPQKIVDMAREVNPAVFRYFLVDSWEARLQTWTQHLPQEFQQRRGYSLLPWLPALCDEVIIDSEHTEAFLHDFRHTIGDMVSDYYFKHMADLCHRQGLEMWSEGIYGEKNNPPVDVLKTYEYCDVPMTEFWARVTANDSVFSYNPWPSKTFVYPLHSSLLYHKPIIGSEAYTGYALYSDSPIDLKTYGDVAYTEGVNSMMLHSYVHQPTEQRPGMTLGVYGQSFNRHNTWFPEAGTWFDYQARAQYLLRQGERCADVLVYTGDELPCPQWTPQQSDSLMRGVKFQYINPDVLLHGRVAAREGQLWLDGKYPFQCLVIRDSLLELSTLRQLAEWADAGIAIYGPKPTRTLSLTNLDQNNRELRLLAERVWSLPNVHPEILDLHQHLRPELHVTDATDLAYIHRRAAEFDVYYLVNRNYTDSLTFTPSLRQDRGWAPLAATLWDPVTGSIQSLPVRQTDAGYLCTEHALTLQPQQSVFLVLSDTQTAGAWATPAVLPTAPLYKLPLVAKGGVMSFPDDASLADQPLMAFTSLTESSDPSVRYYSGRVVYSLPLTLERKVLVGSSRIWLRLPQFGSTARVEVNGHTLRTLWIPGDCVELTQWVRQGDNKLQITVTNPWRNRLIGDLHQERGSAATFTTSPTTIKNDPLPVVRSDARLLPSGLSQTPELIFE